MQLVTTLGDLSEEELGPILPHEHVVADLRPLAERESIGDHSVAAIRSLIEPEVRAAMKRGVTAIVEATPVGVGRRPDAIVAISNATGMPFVLATGVYREPWVPDWIRESSSSQLVDWFTSELLDRIPGVAARAGWIKVSASDDEMTTEEERILRAAARAGLESGCTIGSHTLRGPVVETQLAVLDDEGFPLDRFIWIHAQAEPDVGRHSEMARRGCWIEYDWIGLWPTHEEYARIVEEMVAAGHAGRLLVSQDSGWYQPGDPGAGLGRGPYTRVHDEFLPLLRSRGFDAELIDRITVANPFRAFARP